MSTPLTSWSGPPTSTPARGVVLSTAETQCESLPSEPLEVVPDAVAVPTEPCDVPGGNTMVTVKVPDVPVATVPILKLVELTAFITAGLTSMTTSWQSSVPEHQ